MSDHETDNNSSWATTLFLALLGSALLVFGAWSMHRHHIALPSKFSGLLQFDGVAATFVSASVVTFSGFIYSFAFLYKQKKLLNRVAMSFLLLTLILSAVGFFIG